tara:strand:- start:848 stop:1105 length:258 start_codon:yes stop_codon:yes gene_type:complete
VWNSTGRSNPHIGDVLLVYEHKIGVVDLGIYHGKHKWELIGENRGLTDFVSHWQILPDPPDDDDDEDDDSVPWITNIERQMLEKL